jgi:outer membrane receptor for ferrienterochelin and colicins
MHNLLDRRVVRCTASAAPMPDRTRCFDAPRPRAALLGALVALLALFAAPAAAWAQQRATVTVFVRGPAGPLAGATVSAPGTTVDSDPRGIARLLLPAGTHPLRVTRAGYAAAALTLVLPAARDTSLVVTLDEVLTHAEPIYVVTTRGERLVEEEPVRVEVITREEIEEKLLVRPGSIAMLLDEAAGVRVQETNPAIGGASVRIQGMRGRYAQILVDGLPLHGYGAGALGPLQIPPADLRQVEVIKGAASALHGGAALAGVINLISRLPEEGREVITNRTSRGGTDVVLWSSDLFAGRWGYTLVGGLHAQDQMDIDGDGWAELPRHRRLLARPRVFWGNGASRAMLTAGIMTESRTGGGFVPGGIPHAEASDVQRVDAGGTGRFMLNESLFVDVRASVTRAAHDRRIARRVESDERSSAFGEASLLGRAGVHSWVVGAALQYESLDAGAIDPMLSFAHVTPAIFAQDEITLGRRYRLALSGRVDAHAEYGAFFSPRGALLAGPFGAWTLRLSAGSGFRAPTPLVEEVGEVGLTRIAPLQNVAPERAFSASADLGAGVGPLDFNATVFGSAIRDPIAFLEPPQPGPGRLENVPGRLRTVGTELVARIRAEGAGLTAYHTWLRATEPLPGGGRDVVPLTPDHAAGFIAMIEDDAWGRIGFEAYFTGWQRLDDDPWAERAEPYTVLGLLIERRIGPVSIFVNAENLTNVRQTRIAPLVRPQPTTTGRWTTDVYMPLEGRTVNGGFRVFF